MIWLRILSHFWIPVGVCGSFAGGFGFFRILVCMGAMFEEIGWIDNSHIWPKNYGSVL